ncbi:MAG: ABC transporter permease [Treponema sp.]|nr:ABC transporter permease [Treponema sp.]
MENVKPGKKKSGLWDVWRRFRKNTAAMIGLFVLGLLVLTAVFAGVIAPADPIAMDLGNTFASPSLQSPMGTDNFGRCIFSRIIFGTRTSLRIGFTAVATGLFAGLVIGSLSGFYGGMMDNAVMRFIDILMAIPGILLAIAIVAALGPGMVNVMIAIGLASIPGYTRITRAAVLTVKEREFVEAARAIGGNDFRIIVRHVLPNSLAPIIVQATLGLSSAILSAAGLSFIGLGVQPPYPEWGFMLSDGRRFIFEHGHMVIFPGLAIVVVVLAINLMGDGLRDALDPKLKR